MKLFVGTSGYAYKAWKGAFYPEKIPQSEMLPFYGQHFNAVEINNTFYRMPVEGVLHNWSKVVPDDFQFVLKASRRITHFKRLNDPRDELDYFLKTSSVLRERLGPTLFQLPPNFKKDADLLRNFLSLLPKRWRAAFEFRHASWFEEETYDILRERHAVLAAAQTDELVEPPVIVSADWGYLRLRKTEYSDEEMKRWIDRVNQNDWSAVYVFFKHEDAGTGPRFAKRFRELFTAVGELGKSG